CIRPSDRRAREHRLLRRVSRARQARSYRRVARTDRQVWAMIQEELRARGMPQDLLYLTMIESGFDPNAYSPAHAAGLWQFIAETGQRYGLEVSEYVDERRDPVKATAAALSYLQDM